MRTGFTHLSTVFFGASYKIAQALGQLSSLKTIVNEERKFDQDIYNYAVLHGVSYVSVSTRQQFHELRLAGDVAISCGFGLIFACHQIERFVHGVINIHPGKLPDYRGRHPIGWALLNGESSIIISAHRINHQIDQGTLLLQEELPIDLKDDEGSLSSKLEMRVSDGMLKSIMANLEKPGESLAPGTYYEVLTNKFDSVLPHEVGSRFLFNLFRSKRRYGGITINGKRFTHCNFVNPSMRGIYNQQYSIYLCKDGVEVALK